MCWTHCFYSVLEISNRRRLDGGSSLEAARLLGKMETHSYLIPEPYNFMRLPICHLNWAQWCSASTIH
jgi:hypothetical protein